MINSSMAKFFTVFEKNYYAVQGSFRADQSKKILKKNWLFMALPKIDFFFSDFSPLWNWSNDENDYENGNVEFGKLHARPVQGVY